MSNTSILRVPTKGEILVTLAYAPEQVKRKPSRIREYDYLHNLKDGARIYLDPAAHQDLLAMGAGASDTIRLTPLRRGDEQSCAVELVSEAAEPPAPTPVPASAPELAPISAHTPAAKALAAALCAAIDIAGWAEAYARRQGRTLTFSEESIRAIGIHLNISYENALPVSDNRGRTDTAFSYGLLFSLFLRRDRLPELRSGAGLQPRRAGPGRSRRARPGADVAPADSPSA